ncbi:hypothetical protein C1646_782631 [Rhizophagus diaphanus]|nr:hypothetical protein C1646_782631 [Rhizophagus diaphanus] [Rhizophagus sp. MUCL 43196]
MLNLEDEENISSIARIPGKLITVDTYGNISSVFDRLINNCDPEEGKEIHSIVIHNDNSKLVESPRKMSCSKSKNEHKIYSLYSQNKTKPLVSKEPWVIDVYDRTSVFLDKEENTQLFIGRSTIQVWRKIAGNKKVELEYIWANNAKENREEKSSYAKGLFFKRCISEVKLGDVIGTSLQDFDRKQDNPSKDFGISFLSTYAWLRDSFPQEAIWDFWAVEALTLIGSLVLITVIQNMFIAFLSSAHAEAFEKGRAALLYYRAKLISDYEMIDEI